MVNENNFGKIVTNGINHWICISSVETACPCGATFGREDKYIPVVLDKNGKPEYTVGFRTISREEIKPFAEDL